jgi:hypothetical protein
MQPLYRYGFAMLMLLGAPPSARAEGAKLPDVRQAPPEGWEPIVALTYTIAVPARELRPVLDDVSFLGFEYSVLVPVHRHLYLGVAAAFNNFSDSEGRHTYQLDHGAVTGTYYRTLFATSLTFALRYYFGDSEWLRPSAGLRTGISFASLSRQVVDRLEEDALVGLQVAPEAGIALHLVAGLHLVATYQYVFTTSSTRELDNLSYHCVNFGPQFKY